MGQKPTTFALVLRALPSMARVLENLSSLPRGVGSNPSLRGAEMGNSDLRTF